MSSLELPVDRSRPVADQPQRCHTRWHPDLRPALTCAPGDDVLIDCRDAVDGQLTRASTAADVASVDRSVVHPLTGPIRIEGLGPGDVLEVEVLAVNPASDFAYTAIFPAFGFLRDRFPGPFLVRWDVEAGRATSPDLPGVAIPAAPFMGTMGVAPSHDLLRRILAREQRLAAAGADVALPQAAGAVPATPAVAAEGLRTKPPREFGGNLDVRQLTAGARVRFPVWTDGALFSVGDGHVAQGDGESCGTAIEVAATAHLRFGVAEGAATSGGVSVVAPATPPGGPAFATAGHCLPGAGEGAAEDLTVAARAALEAMLDHLTAERGYTREQAYALCSVAVDLRVAQVVNAPAFTVTAWLPMDIFV